MRDPWEEVVLEELVVSPSLYLDSQLINLIQLYLSQLQNAKKSDENQSWTNILFFPRQNTGTCRQVQSHLALPEKSALFRSFVPV